MLYLDTCVLLAVLTPEAHSAIAVAFLQQASTALAISAWSVTEHLAIASGRGASLYRLDAEPGSSTGHRSSQKVSERTPHSGLWALLLDPVAPEDPACWQGGGLRRGRASAGGGPTQLASRRLSVEALSMDSHALLLEVGRRRWALHDDRQALWAWQERRTPDVERLWLGFVPRRADCGRVIPAGVAQVWVSAPWGDGELPRGWRASFSSTAAAFARGMDSLIIVINAQTKWALN